MLPKEYRLSKKSDFENVRQNGRYITTSKLFTVSLFDRKDKKEPRFGFIVSKKISTKAVVRNKIKRTLREITRKKIESVKAGYDFVVLVKPSILHADHGKLEKEFEEVIGLFKNL